MGSISFTEADKTEIDLWKSELDNAFNVYHAINAISFEQKRRKALFDLLTASDAVKVQDANDAINMLTATYHDVIAPFVK